MSSTADYPPPPPPPPTQLSSFRSHAVDRSIEFLSAARTALKIAQARYHHAGRNNNNHDDAERTLPEWLIDVNPTTLTLYQQHPNIAENSNDENANDTAPSLVRDSHSLLQFLDAQLAELHTLVRRRGHTNDPTLEIQHIIERFQEGAHEIKAVCNALRLAGSRPPRTNAAAAEYDNNSNSSNNNNKTQYSSNQRRKHYEIVSSQLEEYAHVRTDRLKVELGTRSQVLRDQSHRRKLLATGGGSSSSSGNTTSSAAAAKITTNVSLMNNASSAAQLQSPLFLTTTTTTTTAAAAAAKANTSTTTTSRIAPSSSSSSVASASSYPAYVGYGGGGGGSSYSSGGRIISGYGGGGGGVHSGTTTTTSSVSSTTTAMGMRQRRQQQQQSNIQIDNGGGGEEYYDDKYSKLSSTSSSSSMQEQIIQRREARDIKYRTQQARLAERTLADLGNMFTKMSTLISTQGEILVRIEDDVENAYNDINDGQNELVKVYGYTKGNRGLIIKIFCILLFFIVFMKLY